MTDIICAEHDDGKLSSRESIRDRRNVEIGRISGAEETRRTFLVHHPDVPAYLSYLAPNFRVRVGDLRDKLPAEKLRADLKDEFPGLYVVPDDIELPRIE